MRKIKIEQMVEGLRYCDEIVFSMARTLKDGMVKVELFCQDEGLEVDIEATSRNMYRGVSNVFQQMADHFEQMAKEQDAVAQQSKGP